MPSAPVAPIALNTEAITRSVAIVIPDTGLLLAPITPTILAETTEKKNENSTARIPPTGPAFIEGTIHVSRNPNIAAASTHAIDGSSFILS